MGGRVSLSLKDLVAGLLPLLFVAWTLPATWPAGRIVSAEFHSTPVWSFIVEHLSGSTGMGDLRVGLELLDLEADRPEAAASGFDLSTDARSVALEVRYYLDW